MGELRLSYPACAIAGKERLTAEDIDILREHVFVGGIASSQDAEILLAINNSSSRQCPQWRHYFIDAMTAYIVRHCYPQGAMDDVNSDWLISMISIRGVVHSCVELDLLFHIIDVASHVPDRLTVFALGQILDAVTENEGLRSSRQGGSRRQLTKADVQMTSRVMAAIARSRGPRPTPRETDMLRTLGILPGARHGRAIAA